MNRRALVLAVAATFYVVELLLFTGIVFGVSVVAWPSPIRTEQVMGYVPFILPLPFYLPVVLSDHRRAKRAALALASSLVKRGARGQRIQGQR